MDKTPAYFRARTSVLEAIRNVVRGRIVPDDNKEEVHRKEQSLVLLRNGVFPPGYHEEELIANYLRKNPRSNEPLSFTEKTSHNTWFSMHPEKVAGKEIITTSRNFPLTIEGSREDVQRIIQGKVKDMSRMRLKANAFKLKMYLQNIPAPDGDSDPDGLGELVRSEMNANIGLLRKALAESANEKEYAVTDKLSFEEVVRHYNKGITDDEIRAWVWYKRSIGTPMKGWEAYFLPDKGVVGETLYTLRQTIIKDNHFRDIGIAPEGILLGKPTRFSNEYDGKTYRIFTAINGDKQYVSEQDSRIEKTSVRTDPDALRDLVRKSVLFYNEGDLQPYPIYAYGNMYDRELQLEQDRKQIIAEYGEDVFLRQKEIVQKAKPDLLSIFHPDAAMRPKILAISGFANEFYIRELREETGVDLPESKEAFSLTEAFQYYLESLSKDQFRQSSSFEIWNYYILARKITDKDLNEEQRREVKANARNEGEELFSRFLHEALLFPDQEKLNIKWNRIYNGQSAIAYHRIPIGFECSARFRQFNLHFTPTQREGVAFMEAVGSGIIAYDVGVGKTMTAIIALAQAMYCGKASRPLIVVPNPTYGKWIREIIGYTDPKTGTVVPGVLSNTGIRVNEWYNLGTDILKGIRINRKIEAGTITIVTYEGFKKIGFSEKVMEQLFVELTNILYQSSQKTDRDKEIDYQKYREKIGVGLKGTEADIDTLGIDYLVIDEAHRCKNVFEGVKAGEDGKKRFGISGAVSETGIKAFFLCNYIQRTYGRNVMLLTATPFTNSPLEIYSMLSLVACDSMKKTGIYNLQEFFELFVLERTEFVVNYKEEIVPKDTVKSFNNRLLLQKLIYNHINYKTGEEAGVKRPCKINLPRINAVDNGHLRRLTPDQQILTYLAMTDRQRLNQNRITALARSATQGPLNMSAIFRALNYSLDNALSPFLYEGEPVDYAEFVSESPKIRYITECIRSVKEWHEQRGQPVSGQVVYMNRGKDYFYLIKEYLEKETGYKRQVRWNRVSVDEVEIITSEMSQSRKENIKEAFLEGVVKIIIGTSTIREGIDLQRKGTVIYNAYPDWNPTDIRQLEGRIWRQGNEFGYIRSVMPLVQDSMDVFVFQKLEEKTSRINDIWYRGDRGNVLDLESLDPEEVKFALVSDVEVIAGMKLKQIKADISRRLMLVNANLDTLTRFDVILRRFQILRQNCMEHLKKAREIIAATEYGTDASPRKSVREPEREDMAGLVKAIDAFMEAVPQNDRELLRIGRSLSKETMPPGVRSNWLFSEFKQYLSNVKKAEKTILAQKGYTLNDDLTEIQKAFKADQELLEQEMHTAESATFFESLKKEAYQKKSAMAVSGATPEERAAEFARLNYLLAYQSSDVDTDNCQLPVERSDTGRSDEQKRKRLRLKARALKLKLQLMKEGKENDHYGQLQAKNTGDRHRSAGAISQRIP